MAQPSPSIPQNNGDTARLESFISPMKRKAVTLSRITASTAKKLAVFFLFQASNRRNCITSPEYQKTEQRQNACI